MEDRIKNMLKRYGLSGVNKPKGTPSHPTKSHMVLAKVGDKTKLIRFGQTRLFRDRQRKKASLPLMPLARKSFKARHSSNIAKGKMSAAYWADKVKW
jgi:hypothetical protein